MTRKNLASQVPKAPDREPRSTGRSEQALREAARVVIQRREKALRRLEKQ